MTKDDVIAKVKAQNFPQDSYIVFGSGPLAAHDIREVNDIDLLVSPSLYTKLEKKGWKKTYKGPSDIPVTFDVFEAHDNWNFSKYNPTLADLLSRAHIIEDVIFASLEDVKAWKMLSARPKDLKDLKLIEDYLKS